jgi:chitosanase
LNPKLAIILAINFSNSADPSLTNTIGKTLTNLRGSDNKEVQQLASNALQQFLAAKHIKEIINVIESGSKQPQYGALEANGPEDLSYGTTYLRISNGSLYTVLKTYCNSLQATQAKALTQYLPRLESGDKSLASDEAFKNALRAAATDLVMQEIQDQEFEGRYWNPTLSFVESAGLKLPLSRAVIYDTIINSGAGSVRRFAGEVQGPTPAQGADEKRWMSEFLVIRRNYFLTNLGPKFPKFLPGWLARVDLWLNFANRHNWNLEPPFTVQGVQFED